jgi:hypothetical protein
MYGWRPFETVGGNKRNQIICHKFFSGDNVRNVMENKNLGNKNP